jgi:hypothetical protein
MPFSFFIAPGYYHFGVLGSRGRRTYYDAGFKRVYATGGEGFISVYQQESPDQYQLLAKVPSDIGARTSDYPGKIGMKAFNRFYVAIPEGVQHGAQVWMYSVQK